MDLYILQDYLNNKPGKQAAGMFDRSWILDSAYFEKKF